MYTANLFEMGLFMYSEDRDFLMRTWALINLDALDYNVKSIRAVLPEKTKIMGVVKADGYGHGDAQIAQALVQNGVDFLAVSNIEEALSIRSLGLKDSAGNEIGLLILGYTPVDMALTLAKNNIAQTLLSLEYAKKLNTECEKNAVRLCVHIKIDTGMNRIGVIENDIHDAQAEVAQICSLGSLACEGIFSHLSSADMDDAESMLYTKKQMKRFDNLISRLESKGIHFKYHHIQNSAGISVIQNGSYEYARAGIVLYGVAPSEVKTKLLLKPVMSVKTVVSLVKELDEDEAVSYGRRFVSRKKMKLATVPIGYADGYPRLLSNKGYMLVKGKRAKIVGNVCMDQLMLDVTDIEAVSENDVVTVIGTDGNETIGFNELADMIGTIGYELMCLISKRVPRVYKRGGQTVGIVDYISIEP